MKEILKTENRTGQKVPLLTLQLKIKKVEGQIVTEKRLRVSEDFLEAILPLIKGEENMFVHLDQAVPTIIHPNPWREYQIGGYYLNPTSVMRFTSCRVQERSIENSDLARVYTVLNFLGEIGWKINCRVLRVVEDIWDEGGQLGKIPKRHS
jgi:DNA-directed RNA polymerase